MTEDFEERAAILEYDAGMPRKVAEAEAAKRFCPTCRTMQPRDQFVPVYDRNGKLRTAKCGKCSAIANAVRRERGQC